MRSPTLEQINDIRKTGFRPGVVGCLINNDKVLLFYKREYDQWTFPQGGINNGETGEQALVRNMRSEVGESLVKNFDPSAIVIGHSKIEFSEKRQNVKDLQTDDGVAVNMVGKTYFFYVIIVKSTQVNIEDTDFDDYYWCDGDEADYLINTLKVKNKKAMMLSVLELLKSEGYIK